MPNLVILPHESQSVSLLQVYECPFQSGKVKSQFYVFSDCRTYIKAQFGVSHFPIIVYTDVIFLHFLEKLLFNILEILVLL